MSSKKLGDFERLPEYKYYFLVDPGISNEWDMFWLMSYDEEISYFEICYDYRRKKMVFHKESQK